MQPSFLVVVVAALVGVAAMARDVIQHIYPLMDAADIENSERHKCWTRLLARKDRSQWEKQRQREVLQESAAQPLASEAPGSLCIGDPYQDKTHMMSHYRKGKRLTTTFPKKGKGVGVCFTDPTPNTVDNPYADPGFHERR